MSKDSTGDWKSWAVFALAIIGALMVGRFALGLIWGLLPVLLVAAVLYGGYKMLSSDDDKKQLDYTPPSRSTRARGAADVTHVSGRSGSMQSEDALNALKRQMGKRGNANIDDDRMARQQEDLDEFDRRMAELERELGEADKNSK